MKSNTLLVFIIALLVGCTATKQTPQAKIDQSVLKHQEANSAYSNGDYQKALTTYEEVIEIKRNQNKRVDSTIYQNAGIAAWELKQADKSIHYLELAKRYSAANEKTYSILAKAFLEKDNLSKEITNLDGYIAKYPEGEEIQAIRTQLFTANIRSENWEPAYKLWPTLGINAQNDLKLLSGYFKVNDKLNYKNQLDKIARLLLKLDNNNVEALEFLAEKYYWLAENSYVKEMKAYQANKTDKQYKQLLAAYKVYFENYRIAKDYFLHLYQITPKSRYATFLGNIFTRYENKEKADYYYNLAKKN